MSSTQLHSLWRGSFWWEGTNVLRVVIFSFFEFNLYYIFPLPFSVFFKKKLLLFNYSCLHFLPIPPPHPSKTHPLPTFTLPLDFVHVSFIVVPLILSPLPPPHSPLAIVTLFLTSLSLVIFCLQTGEATVENSMEFSQKTKNGTALWPRNSAAGTIP